MGAEACMSLSASYIFHSALKGTAYVMCICVMTNNGIMDNEDLPPYVNYGKSWSETYFSLTLALIVVDTAIIECIKIARWEQRFW